MPTAYTLPDHTHIDSVALRTADLDRALSFYADGLGLTAHVSGDEALLSAGDDAPPILHLIADGAAVRRPSHATGLYHTAIRLPTRAALGAVVLRLIERRTRFQGFSDHGVSEAIYLPDADGLGVELYRDRPRAEWPVTPDGKLIDMVTTALDIDDLLAAVSPAGAPAGTDIGHIHLHVSDLRRAEAFWCGLLGFSVMQRNYPGALFVAAGGYHHHIGLNTWAGDAAPPPNAVGMVEVRLAVPDGGSLIDRVRGSGRAYEGITIGGFDGAAVSDDDGNRVVILPVG